MTENTLDAALSDILWRAQLDPSGTPRIVRCSLVNVAYSYVIPGALWPDGRARVIVNPLEVLDVPGTLQVLAREDTAAPGAEPPTQDHRGTPSRDHGHKATDPQEES